MFSLTIVFGPGPMVWTLMFKTQENFQNAFDNWTYESITITDDFGQACSVDPSKAHGWMVEDLNLSKGAHIERALHQARTKIAGDKLAESDPVIKEAARRQQGGMPMIQSMGAMPGFANGGFRG